MICRRFFWIASWTVGLARFKPLLLLPLLLCVSCASFPGLGQLTDVKLDLQVAATETPGVYAVSGETNLPDQTQLTIAAVRYLSLESGSLENSAASAPTPTYSILAYQPAQIQHNQWQTRLNLWQVAPDGDYQETWQLEQAQLGLSFQPAREVVFLATLNPIDQLSRLEPLLAMRGMQLDNRTVQTSEGQRYAQVDRAIAIALPTGKTTPPVLNPNQVNYGWGDRYVIPQEPQNPGELEFPRDRQTNAPPAPDEFLR
jgi:hypothetical protein